MDREKLIEDIEKQMSEPTNEYVVLWFSEAEYVLELLKEHDPVKPRVSSVEQRCGNCNYVIEKDGWKACPWCGKPIDWESWWREHEAYRRR